MEETEKIEEFYNLSKPKIYRYAWYIRLFFFLGWIFIFYAFIVTIAETPMEYWLQSWFIISCVIVFVITFCFLKMLTDKIEITKNSIIIRDNLFLKNIQIDNIKRVVKPLSASNKTKNYYFILDNDSRIKVGIFLESTNPFELYYYLETISDYVNKKSS